MSKVQHDHATVEKIMAEKIQKNTKDTGSAGVQVCHTTLQIMSLTAHLKSNPNDHHCKRGLMKAISTRTRQLRYMKKNDSTGYAFIMSALNLRA